MRKQISLNLHGAFEIVAAPALIVAPFLIDFPTAGGIASFVIGVLLMGLTLSTLSEPRSIPLTAQAGLERVLAVAMILTGLAIGLVGGFATATIFMAGFGIAHLALTSQTRYSAPLSA
jgi:hypothetical protein